MRTKTSHALAQIGTLAVLAANLTTCPAPAQVSTATISGMVRDTSNAVITGAQVTVRNVDTGFQRKITTEAQGRYSAPDLPLGTYEVRVEMAGFQATVRSGIALTVGREAVVDLVLSVGQVAEAVTVTGDAPLVDTATATVGSLVDNRQLTELPLNGRNYAQLTLLATGVQQITTGLPSSFMGRGVRITVAGTRPTGQSTLLDGADIQGYWNNGTGSVMTGTTLGIEAIREFQTATNTFSAEYGRAAGGIINAVTKSGTNTLHGSVFEFLRNDKLDARNFFDNQKPAYRQNQFGFSAGGPIHRDKTFFFGNYEGLRVVLGVTKVAGVLDQQARNGFLQDPKNPGSYFNIGVDPNVKPFLSLFPLPNGRNFGDGTAEYVSSQPRPATENYYMGRLDHRWSDKLSLFGRYVFDGAQLIDPYVQNVAIPGYPELDLQRNQYVTLGQSVVLSPTWLDNSTFSYVRTKQGSSNILPAPLLQFFPPPREPGLLNVGTLTSVGGSNTAPLQFLTNNFSFTNDMNVLRGKHNFKFGVAVERMQANTFMDWQAGGAYSFADPTFFLRNKPISATVVLPGEDDSHRGWRQTLWGFYVQDSWKAHPRLTLDLGLRYEVSTNPIEINGKIAPLVNITDTQFTHTDHVFKTNPSLQDFGPRFGFAWDAFGRQKTSIRGGFGIYYDQILARSYGFLLTHPPYFSRRTLLGASFPNPLANVANTQSIPFTFTDILSYKDTRSTPYTMQYNLNTEHEILPDTVLTVGYVGSRGVHLSTGQDLNIPPPTAIINGDPFWGTPDLINPRYLSVGIRRTEGNSTYHSLQVSLRKRFSHGFQMQGSYTYSKVLDESSGLFNGEFMNTPLSVIPGPTRRRDWGPAAFDRRQVFTGNFVYDLPFATKNRFVDGWQISGVVAINTGPPFTVTNGLNRQPVTSITGGVRPNVRPGGSNNPILGTPDKWFDASQFQLQPIGFLGNIGKDTVYGPGTGNFDVSFIKDTRLPKITEVFAVQFRAEFFNIFNRANFAYPSGRTIFTSENGIPAANAGRITGTTTSSRQIQFGLKVIF